MVAKRTNYFFIAKREQDLDNFVNWLLVNIDCEEKELSLFARRFVSKLLDYNFELIQNLNMKVNVLRQRKIPNTKLQPDFIVWISLNDKNYVCLIEDKIEAPIKNPLKKYKLEIERTYYLLFPELEKLNPIFKYKLLRVSNSEINKDCIKPFELIDKEDFSLVFDKQEIDNYIIKDFFESFLQDNPLYKNHTSKSLLYLLQKGLDNNTKIESIVGEKKTFTINFKTPETLLKITNNNGIIRFSFYTNQTIYKNQLNNQSDLLVKYINKSKQNPKKIFQTQLLEEPELELETFFKQIRRILVLTELLLEKS